MTKDQNDRIVVAYELIGKALEGIHEEIARAGKRYWPEPGQQREVIVSRVLTEEDKIRERQGINIPIEQWLRNLPEPEKTQELLENEADSGSKIILPKKKKSLMPVPKLPVKDKRAELALKKLKIKPETLATAPPITMLLKKEPQGWPKNRS